MWDPSILLEFYIFPLQEYRVVLPSFLAEGGSKMNPAQRQIRGIFDDHIHSHTPGDKFIFEVESTGAIKPENIVLKAI